MARLNKHLGKLSFGIAAGAGIAAISAGDRSTLPSNAGLGAQIKMAIGSTINRLSGGNLNPLGAPTVQGWNFNWQKAFNNIFWGFAAVAGYGIIGPKLGLRLPLTGAAKKIGGPAAIVSFIMGGLDPAPGNPANAPGPSRPLPMGYGGGNPGRGKYS